MPDLEAKLVVGIYRWRGHKGAVLVMLVLLVGRALLADVVHVCSPVYYPAACLQHCGPKGQGNSGAAALKGRGARRKKNDL